MGTIQICETCWSRQNSQLAGQILFCPGVSAGHFQKLFRALLSNVLQLALCMYHQQQLICGSMEESMAIPVVL